MMHDKYSMRIFRLPYSAIRYYLIQVPTKYMDIVFSTVI